ncbi:MAG: hypothetical protein ABH881_01915 [bacterium]
MANTNKNQTNKNNDDLELVSSNNDDSLDDLELNLDSSRSADSGQAILEKDESEIDEKEIDEKETGVVISQTKIDLIRKLLLNIKENGEKITQLLYGVGGEEERKIGIGQIEPDAFFDNKEREEEARDGQIIEGVFDGENMIGPDGKQYNVPANYASKSKLIEGDILKLTITGSGIFIYKQISPIERKRIIGELEQVSDGNYIVKSEDNKRWKVLTASVTYYKGQSGDKAVILVPKVGESKWAAVDNVVRNA